MSGEALCGSSVTLWSEPERIGADLETVRAEYPSLRWTTRREELPRARAV